VVSTTVLLEHPKRVYARILLEQEQDGYPAFPSCNNTIDAYTQEEITESDIADHKYVRLKNGDCLSVCGLSGIDMNKPRGENINILQNPFNKQYFDDEERKRIYLAILAKTGRPPIYLLDYETSETVSAWFDTLLLTIPKAINQINECQDIHEDACRFHAYQ
jgi:hypothetical protein